MGMGMHFDLSQRMAFFCSFCQSEIDAEAVPVNYSNFGMNHTERGSCRSNVAQLAGLVSGRIVLNNCPKCGTHLPIDDSESWLNKVTTFITSKMLSTSDPDVFEAFRDSLKDRCVFT